MATTLSSAPPVLSLLAGEIVPLVSGESWVGHRERTCPSRIDMLVESYIIVLLAGWLAGRDAPALVGVRGWSAAAEAAAAVVELGQGLLEGFSCEVGPELVAEHELGVGGLPEQVVG